jgi:hypothetical protein
MFLLFLLRFFQLAPGSRWGLFFSSLRSRNKTMSLRRRYQTAPGDADTLQFAFFDELIGSRAGKTDDAAKIVNTIADRRG